MTPAFDEPSVPRLLIEYYTDPLCGRSWAFEPHWRRLRAEFGHRFAWCYRLGGLLRGRAGGAFAPSYLPCLAVQCAEQLSPQAGSLYLCALREAALAHGRDITRLEVLMAVANELAAQAPGGAGQLLAVFDAAAFRQALAATSSAQALPAAGPPAQYLLPTQPGPALVLRSTHQPAQAVALGGQPYEVLLQELADLAPDLFYVPSLIEGGAG